ncbi:MAG: hypothetical protein Q3964_03710, partial [Carnobacterium sp.]|nr:hypothetical protein [Carnobacterium sp.]
MDNTKILQKLTALFLVFIMLFGIIVPNTVVFSEGVLDKNTIVDVEKTDTGTEKKINSEEQEDKKDNQAEVKDEESGVKEETIKPKFNNSLTKSV